MNIPKRPSLLEKNDEQKDRTYSLEGPILKDLGIEDINYMFRNTDRNAFKCMKLLAVMQTDKENIEYRLDIMEDFITHASVREAMRDVLVRLVSLKNEFGLKKYRIEDVHKDILWKFNVMQTYAKVIREMKDILGKCKDDVSSEGLKRLIGYIDDIYESENYQFIVEQLPKHQKDIDNMKGITIGVNMNKMLEPQEAVILSFEPKPFRKKSFLTRFFDTEGNDEKILNKSQFYTLGKVSKEGVENAFLKDLGQIIRLGLQQTADLMDEYFTGSIEELLAFDLEIDFYMAGFHMVERAKALGVPMVRPIVADTDERVCSIDDLMDLSLAVRMKKEDESLQKPGEKIVKNNLRMDNDGRILIITGPNRGGKTTFTRAVGMSYMLFQAGLYVPGTSAHMSPVDKLFSHFPKEEERRVDEGRLGEELRELSDIMENVTKYSLVLLNESLSSTSAYDSLVICENLMRAFRTIGTRVIFSTHLHELAYKTEELNREVEGDSKVIGLCSQVKKVTQDGKTKHVSTYKIIPAVTDGKSYANDIAYKYGMAYDQLMEKYMGRDEDVN